ncbi:tetratricopeptide repeat protein [Pseudoduganella sp. SL102]|uniref:tetratricopeptide repeat protein n=1 Tax=Pseudoduganella sp. SL102 TaxID=2995154 RepID=UPI00248C9934|nr:tetratricopeptide repeat protein [Pseudoduganella sp. SL102]WBS03467.1 tetratricopeptide repeat protein [Pseudoduganella sp. SL102]
MQALKYALAIVTLSALLSACAVAPQKQAGGEAAAAPAAPPAVAAESEDPGADAIAATLQHEEKLPAVELTSDLFYKLTKAELDFKRGQWQSAYVSMMVLAQQTRDPRLARRSAEMALAAKQGNEALAAIRLWRELAPDSDEAVQYFLGFSVLGDDLSESEQVFAQRLGATPAEARGLVMFQMQQYLLRAKDKAAAFALMERVLAPYGATMESHLVLAQAAYAAENRDRAMAEAKRALELKPDSELSALTLAQVMGDADAAGQLFAGFLKKNPNAREVRSAYARLLVEQKRYDAARAQFERMLKDEPDNPGTLYALGIMSIQASDQKGAEDYLRRFVAVLGDSDDPERDPSKGLMLLAQIAEERGDFDGALGWLDKVSSDDPRLYMTSRLKRAHLTAKKGELERARTMLHEIAAVDPAEQAEVLQTEGQLLRDAGRNGEAYMLLADAVQRFPDSPDLLYDFALAAEKQDKPEEMEAALRKVMAAVPDNHHAYNALGYSLAERGVRLDEAHALIDKALKMAPNDPYIMDSMGWVQFRQGRLDEAEATLRRAYALRSDAEIAVHLGEVLWQRGKRDEAQKLWREARAKDPGSDALRDTLARLNTSL